jgi:hypothetical protein
MSNPNPDMWTITNGSNSPSVGAALNGLHIKKTSTAYELYPQNLTSQRLSKVDATSLPVTFEDVSIGGTTWDITVDTLPSATDAGSWVTPSLFSMKPEDTNTSGEFTAQAGGGVVPEEAAASAGKQ